LNICCSVIRGRDVEMGELLGADVGPENAVRAGGRTGTEDGLGGVESGLPSAVDFGLERRNILGLTFLLHTELDLAILCQSFYNRLAVHVYLQLKEFSYFREHFGRLLVGVGVEGAAFPYLAFFCCGLLV
jgi:hypothetical protein